jgi:2'-5' RNA ligase
MSDAPPAQAFRLFIALTIPEEVKSEIEKAQAELRRTLPKGGVRWTRREQFHLTLKFLGNVEAQRVEPLADAVRGACQGFGTLDLRAERIGFFPDLRSPRVVWAGVRDQREQLPRLQSVVEAATRNFSAEDSSEKFTGHVTLGRIKTIRRPETEILARLAGGLATRFFGAWTADKIEIIRSQLSPDGAGYTTLATIPLAGEQR